MKRQNLHRAISVTGLEPRKYSPIVLWQAICTFVMLQYDIKKRICIGCGKGTMYDKNGKQYPFTKFMQIEEVKRLVEEIKKINSDDTIRNKTTNTAFAG